MSAPTRILIDIDGQSKTLSQWAADAGLHYSAVKKRYKRGLRGKDLIAPVHARRAKHVSPISQDAVDRLVEFACKKFTVAFDRFAREEGHWGRNARIHVIGVLMSHGLSYDAITAQTGIARTTVADVGARIKKAGGAKLEVIEKLYTSDTEGDPLDMNVGGVDVREVRSLAHRVDDLSLSLHERNEARKKLRELTGAYAALYGGSRASALAEVVAERRAA